MMTAITISFRVEGALIEVLDKAVFEEKKRGNKKVKKSDILRRWVYIGAEKEQYKAQNVITEERYQTLFIYQLEILCVLRKVVNASDRELYLRALNDLDKMLIHHRNKEKNEALARDCNS